MNRFRYPLLWLLALGAVIYVSLVLFVPIRPRGDGLRAIFLVLSGWGLFAYWRPFRQAMASPEWPGGGMLYAVMIWLICAAINMNCAIGLFWRLAGQPAHLVNNPIFDLWVVLGSVALLIAVTVPNLFGKGVPPIDRIKLGAVWAAMFAAVLYLVLIRPDLGWLADHVRPVTDYGYNYDDPH